MSEKKSFLLRASEIAEKEATFSHPWNPNSLITGTQMSRLAGLARVGVSLAKIPPGKESFIYHAHYREEEWIYIISGRGVAEIDGEEFEVSAGDFMGFPTPSVAHHLRNPYDEELVYLVTTLTANCKQCSGSISNSRMRLSASQADYCLSLHRQESVVQPTHVLKDLMRCSSLGQ
ncbi:cupin domain-containing protein [Kalymmatonema gypsitolerans NIES-4073]|nr:cupin domain-containing protein [Scytonema sp. NIES-4073]